MRESQRVVSKMKVTAGLVGMPNAGKSTLFNALTRGQSPIGNYPFTTRDRHWGVTAVPDERLDRVAAIMKSPQALPAGVEVIDIAGLVKGASRGEGLGNQFLGHIREVDAIIHVVRCFEDDSVATADDSGSPLANLEIVETELMLSDVEMLERRLKRLETEIKARDKTALAERDTIVRVQDALSRGEPAASVLADTSRVNVLDVPLLTARPAVVVANVSDETDEAMLTEVTEYANTRCYPMVRVNARIAHELLLLSDEEREEFALEFTDTDTAPVVHALLSCLNLISFFTANASEARQWLVPAGTLAPTAAGQVHSDMERGFIACEVIGADQLAAAGSWSQARESGELRLEGSGYSVNDGDVIVFRFTSGQQR